MIVAAEPESKVVPRVSPRFSLLILIVLLTGLAMLAPQEVPRGPQEATWEEQVAAVRQGEANSIHLTSESITDQQLQDLRGLMNVRELKLEGGNVTAAGLAVLADLPQLEVLWLRGSRVDNLAAEQIANNRNLRRLNLPAAEFDDAGLAHLVNLPQLEQLRFSSRRVTAHGLASLGRAMSLRWLQLIDVPLDRAALREIAKLDKLESLYLDDVAVDESALEAFFAARPDVHMHVDQQHHDRDPRWHTHGNGRPHRH